MILAIDTTSAFGSLALAQGAEVVELVSVHSPEGFAQVLFQEILRLVGRQGLKLADLEGYAAASGPGSFTGVRIGLAAAKGLAEAHGRLVAPVSNLLALAAAGEGELRAPVIDARRGEVYGAVYDENLRAVVEEMVGPLDRFLERVGDRRVRYLTTSFRCFPAGGRVLTVSSALAGLVAAVAARAFAEGRALAPEQVDANYVRRSDAELAVAQAFLPV